MQDRPSHITDLHHALSNDHDLGGRQLLLLEDVNQVDNRTRTSVLFSSRLGRDDAQVPAAPSPSPAIASSSPAGGIAATSHPPTQCLRYCNSLRVPIVVCVALIGLTWGAQGRQ